jgi:hypothetical protein
MPFHSLLSISSLWDDTDIIMCKAMLESTAAGDYPASDSGFGVNIF